MKRFSRRSGVVQALTALTPVLLAQIPKIATGQQQTLEPPFPRQAPPDTRLPNGKMQRDEILKADYEQNVKDAAELTRQAGDFQLDLEKSDRYVLSLALLKKLDEIEKITKRIRGRMKH